MSSEAGHRSASQRRSTRSISARAGAVLGALALSTLAGGCMRETDAWLWDPSVVGRWEHTPTVVPVLDRIDIIEAGMLDTVDVTEVRPEDLQPGAVQYRVGPGDIIRVQIYHFPVENANHTQEIVVEQVGDITLQQIGSIQVAGMNARQIERAIARALVDQGILTNPDVLVTVGGRLDQTYRIFGAIQRPGIAQIPRPDFRLLDAVIDAGGVNPVIRHIYVIRQVQIDGASTDPSSAPPSPVETQPADNPESILDLIDEITGEGAVDPAMLSTRPNVRRMPDTSSGRSQRNLVDELLAGRGTGAGPIDEVSPAVFSQDGQPTGGPEPVIDLDGTTNFRPTPVGSSADIEGREAPAGQQGAPSARPSGRWIFEGGRWVRRASEVQRDAEGLPEGDNPLDDAEYAVAQRVIRVPVRPLIDGDARYNIVIRPGDIISVRSPDIGQVYIGGSINRDGVYNLNGQTQLTLLRAVIAAGNYSAIAIPERVDLTRMVGDNRQATIRLDARAIANGTAPDILLKPDDMLNFGTNFWATPLAVVRGGFRTSYGFGFLLDRNFGNDVFGAPPTNQFGQ